MKGLSYTDRMNILCGEAIERKGIMLYPITVRDYEQFEICKSVLSIRQSTLPASYVSMNYLQALFCVDRDNGYQLGLMARLIKLLSMSTGADVHDFKLLGKEDANTLGEIRFTVNGEVKSVTPANYRAIRQAIAFLNREELPDESENTELVQAQEDIASMQDMSIDYNLERLFESVAAAYKIRVRDLMGWTIRDFKGIASALDREKQYMLTTGAEYSGNIKWTKGNPCPSWQFDKKKSADGVLESISSVAERFGLKK